MRGTSYAIVEIIWWLLVAAAIGFLVGWILRKWSIRKSLAAEWEGQLAAEQEKVGRLEADLASQDGDLTKLRTELESGRTRLSGLQADFDAKSAELEDASSSLGAGNAPGDGLPAAAVTPLGGSSEQDRIAELQAELDACAEHAGVLEEALAKTSIKAGPLPDKAIATARVAEIATRTRGADPVTDDDLKKIRGVGPKLEGLLKGFGITSFRQVARFTPDDVSFVTAALDAFPGRIERDDWMASAAEQHRLEYGEPVEPLSGG